MSIYHFYAVVISLFAYAFQGISFYGWGCLLSRVFSPDRSDKHSLVSGRIWQGWVVSLSLFQLLHLFFPIRPYLTIPVYSLGFVYGCYWVIHNWRDLPFLRKKSSVFFSLCFVLFAVWLSSKAMLPVNHYDAGLYYLTTVRWLNTYPIIPGVGNLHLNLAANQSLFVYVASLNIYPLFMHGRSLGNSTLLLMTLLTCFEASYHKLYPFREFRRYIDPEVTMYGIMGIGLIWMSLSSNGLSSSGPDLASAFLQVSIFAFFVRLVNQWQSKSPFIPGDFATLSLLATVALTVKLSNIVFCFVIFMVAISLIFPDLYKKLRYTILLFFMLGIVVATFFVRGYILSGVPLFPSTLGHIDFDWAMPKDMITYYANWVYSWARAPFVQFDQVLGNWKWIDPWFERISVMHTQVVYPLVIWFFTSLIAVSFLCFRRTQRKYLVGLRNMILLLPLICGLLFWFFTAPDPRFAEGLFLLLLVAGCLFLGDTVVMVYGRNHFSALIFLLIFVFGTGHFLFWISQHKWSIRVISSDGWHPNPTAEFVQKRTKSGLMVFVPAEGDRIWDGPLPCTPNFNPALRLRENADFKSGFTVKPSHE